MTTHLFDVSEYQAPLTVTDWQRLFNEQHRRYGSSGAAIIRIDYGDAHPDLHLANRATALKAGAKALGLYQYGVDGQPTHLQAEAFISLVKTLHPGEFTILDKEEGSGNLAAEAGAWFTDVDHALTYPGYHGGWLYSGESFFTEHGLTSIKRSHRWVAAYRTAEPTLPHVLWQHTDGKLGDTACQPWPLIGHIDCSIFHGTVAQLAARIWTPPKPPAPHIEGDDVLTMYLDPRQKPAPVWIANGFNYRWVQTAAERDHYRSRGVPLETPTAVQLEAILKPLIFVGAKP